MSAKANTVRQDPQSHKPEGGTPRRAALKSLFTAHLDNIYWSWVWLAVQVLLCVCVWKQMLLSVFMCVQRWMASMSEVESKTQTLSKRSLMTSWRNEGTRQVLSSPLNTSGLLAGSVANYGPIFLRPFSKIWPYVPKFG